MRQITYAAAISEALVRAMEADPAVFITGISVNYSSAVFGTVKEARERFPERVISAPAMENALTGICIGAASQGLRPIIVHDRADFSFLAFDQIINLAAKWRYMYGGNAGDVPIVVRMIIGRGWGQGATHSQSIQSMLANVPGLAVIMPSSPAEAKLAILKSCAYRFPSVILEHRSLYPIEGDPDAFVSAVVKEGTDITIVATSFMMQEAKRATAELEAHGISVELVSTRHLHGYDALPSVRKTGRLLVCDTGHEKCGVAGEIIAFVAERAFDALKAPPRRLTLPNCPAPVAHSLEEAFYPKASTIAALALEMLGRSVPSDIDAMDRSDSFNGPY